MKQREEYIESGIVLRIADGIAEINLQKNAACKECSSIFCKPNEDGDNIVFATDSLGVKPGDRVSISIGGGAVYKASFYLYALPLIILVTSLLTCLELLAGSAQKELYSFLASMGIAVLYYLGLRLFSAMSNAKPHLPKIIKISTLETEKTVFG